MKKTFTILLFICAATGINAQDKLYPNEFPLSQITLLEGPLKHARDLNIETLLKYDCDRLMAPYRKEAGLTPKAKCYPNWDGLDGHVGGHYLTAMAINAATGNEECRKRMEYIISEIAECAEANCKTVEKDSLPVHCRNIAMRRVSRHTSYANCRTVPMSRCIRGSLRL